MNKKRPVMWLLMAVWWLTSALTTHAAMDFSVKAIIPENQVDKEVTYFDLRVTPKQEQELSITIINPTDKPVTVLPTIGPAITNSNGVVEYGGSTTYKLDKTAPFNLADVLTVKDNQTEIVVPKQSQVPLKLVLKVPEEPFIGYVAGGITLKQKDDPEKEGDQKKQGVAIENTFAYNIAILLTESDEKLTPKLEMPKVKVGQDNYRNTIFAYFKNPESRFINKMTVDARITKKGSDTVLYEKKQSEMQVAPNTTFDFPISLEGQPMKAGRYLLIADVEGSNETWHFEKEFEIKAEEARKYNKADVSIERPDYTWWYVLGGVLFLLLIIYAMWRRRQEKKHQAELDALKSELSDLKKVEPKD